MTIDQIKEWRRGMNKAKILHYYVGMKIIDTLLAEVELEKGNHANTKHCLKETRKELTTAEQKLAVATEALRNISKHFIYLQLNNEESRVMWTRGSVVDVYQYIATDALKQMEAVNELHRTD